MLKDMTRIIQDLREVIHEHEDWIVFAGRWERFQEKASHVKWDLEIAIRDWRRTFAEILLMKASFRNFSGQLTFQEKTFSSFSWNLSKLDAAAEKLLSF